MTAMPRLLLPQAALVCALLGCEGGKAPEEAPSRSATTAPVKESTGPKPMMIVFSRDYCTPCQVMKPWVDEIAKDHNTKLDVTIVNVDRKRYEHMGDFFKVSAVPMLVFVDSQGAIKERSLGLTAKKQMASTLRGLGWID